MPADVGGGSPAVLEPFGQFEELVRRACGAPTSWQLPDQVRYLKQYLCPCSGWEPKAVLVEKNYTDRHYLEEYTAYYANTLRPPTSRTTRLHVFQLEVDSVREHLASAFEGREAHEKAERALAQLPHARRFNPEKSKSWAKHG